MKQVFIHFILLCLITSICLSISQRHGSDLPWQMFSKSSTNIFVNTSNINAPNDESFIETIEADTTLLWNFYSLTSAENISTVCIKVLEDLSINASSFMSCSVLHSRPLTVCEMCVENYIDFLIVYKKICTEPDTSEMKTCQEQLLNKDKLHIVRKACDFVTFIWDKGHCDNCFKKENDHLTTNHTDDVIRFFNLSESVWQCFDKTHMVHEEGETEINDTCIICKKPYHALTNMYRTLTKKYKDNMCIDVTDSMNITRHQWSFVYKCTEQKNTGTYLYILASMVLILVILFYLLFFLSASAKITILIGQKRFSRLHNNQDTSGHFFGNDL